MYAFWICDEFICQTADFSRCYILVVSLGFDQLIYGLHCSLDSHVMCKFIGVYILEWSSFAWVYTRSAALNSLLKAGLSFSTKMEFWIKMWSYNSEWSKMKMYQKCHSHFQSFMLRLPIYVSNHSLGTISAERVQWSLKTTCSCC
jgi:hypothetical protein